MPSSPSNIHAPPMGSSFREYLTPPLMKEKSVGPMPTENSTTRIPFLLPIKKCPSSWEITTILKIIMN